MSEIVFRKSVFCEFWDRFYLSLNSIQGIQNFLKPGVGSTNLEHNTNTHTVELTILKPNVNYLAFLLNVLSPLHESLMTHLEKDPDHCESIRLAGCLAKARVLSVPVHQMKLTRKRSQVWLLRHRLQTVSHLIHNLSWAIVCFFSNLIEHVLMIGFAWYRTKMAMIMCEKSCTTIRMISGVTVMLSDRYSWV